VNREVKLEELYGKVLSFVIKDNKFITGVKKKLEISRKGPKKQ
jgi:hypothetical protein